MASLIAIGHSHGAAARRQGPGGRPL